MLINPVTVNSEICQILTCLPEKYVVDAVNGIDVVHDHIRKQKGRTEFFDRLYDGFSGQGQRRQTEINACLADSVEGALKWLNEVSGSLAKSNLAIACVGSRVAMLQGNLIELTHYSADTKRELLNLSQAIANRCSALESEMARLNLVQSATDHLELVFSRWSAGKFISFSLSGRCYAALEELRWGAFGDFCRQNTEQNRSAYIEILQNRAIAQMAEDANCAPTARGDVRQWLEHPTGRGVIPDAKEALAYIGDWASPESTPFVYSTSRLPKDKPVLLPRICSVERVAEALVTEVFTEIHL